MFNRLPPELVRQIIESSVPSTYRNTTYDNRQTLLRSLCLVCKLFRDIAQPLLFEFVWIDRQWQSDALHTTLESEGWRGTIRRLVFDDEHDQRLDTGHLEKLLRSCQGLISLTLQLEYSGPSDLSVIQNLPHLADLSLSGRDYQFPSSFKLHGLTFLSIDNTSVVVAPTLLNPEVLPSLRSLAMFTIYDDDDIAYLNRSRLDDLLPQLEVLFLDSRIIRRGLDYLTPALSRTLFEFDPPSSDDRIDLLQVAQHLRFTWDLDLEEDIPDFVAFIASQDRQISLRSIYLDISLEDLSSLSSKEVKAVEDLLRACMEKRIEISYEDQETGLAGELRLSEEFRRRQREVRKLEATRE
ncbi:hypothetical protein JCM5353_006177 [Sporobolomyces roseus]